MSLKERLFPHDSNITGYTDRNNRPILVGHQIKDESGTTVKVFSNVGNFFVSSNEEMSPFSCPLSQWIIMSAWVEIIEQKKDTTTMTNAQASDYLHGTPFGATKPTRKTKRNY